MRNIAEFIKFLSLAPLTIFAYLITITIRNKFNKRIEEARGEETKESLEKTKKKFKQEITMSLKKSNKVKSVFERTEERLKKLGNPYKLTALGYYLIRILAVLLGLILFVKSGRLSVAIGFTIFIFFFVDAKYFLSNRDDEKMIKEDFIRVYNVLDELIYANMTIDRALGEAHEVIKLKRLREAFIDLSAEVITKKNLSEALDNFKAKFKSREIDSFVLATKQAIETGRITSMIQGQRKILFTEYTNGKDVETENAEMKVLFSLIFMVCSIGAITIYVFADKIIKGLNFILI